LAHPVYAYTDLQVQADLRHKRAKAKAYAICTLQTSSFVASAM